MTRLEGITKIEDLINEFADLDDDLYIELLEEMEDHASTARQARQEELEKDGDEAD